MEATQRQHNITTKLDTSSRVMVPPDDDNIDATPTKLDNCDRGRPHIWALKSHYKSDNCDSGRPQMGRK